MDNTGWVKLYRKTLRWKWSGNPNMVALLAHVILNANYCDSMENGKLIPRGSFLTTHKKLSEATGISAGALRTCLERLKSDKVIFAFKEGNATLITVINYDKYQSEVAEAKRKANRQTSKKSRQ